MRKMIYLTEERCVRESERERERESGGSRFDLQPTNEMFYLLLLLLLLLFKMRPESIKSKVRHLIYCHLPRIIAVQS
jgi:hypothetical protein